MEIIWTFWAFFGFFCGLLVFWVADREIEKEKKRKEEEGDEENGGADTEVL